jgi:hypothetical protein
VLEAPNLRFKVSLTESYQVAQEYCLIISHVFANTIANDNLVVSFMTFHCNETPFRSNKVPLTAGTPKVFCNFKLPCCGGATVNCHSRRDQIWTRITGRLIKR